MSEFAHFFTEVTGYDKVHQWQMELARPHDCGNRLIRIPTGFGKTLGVLAAWTWHRVCEQNGDWPRRLIWCLPMRVLVEQTEREVRMALERLDLLWDEKDGHDGKVGVHLLMGGANAGRWHLYPECDAVLIGTQDMLLSRAMNRGYASPRARWPMEFGLLNHDALWVMDEVQLMDVALATSGQLQAFRAQDQEAGKSIRPCCTWWMSATLQHDWFEKSPDTTDLLSELKRRTHKIEPRYRTGPLWEEVRKPVEIAVFKDAQALARDVSQRHRNNVVGTKGLTLVVLNTVDRAVDVWKALQDDKALDDTDIRLVHSRFRHHERSAWCEDFLNRAACSTGVNRIIVSTQVIEAGVDLSASLLITELAPWPSLVQRFGRCARWGGVGQVMVVDFKHMTDKQAAPYTFHELQAAHKACTLLRDVAPVHLERFEAQHSDLLSSLYPYEPTHLLLYHELNELFDTTPDLSGADIDISRFIRSGDERDVQVFWADLDGSPPSDMKPVRDELCSIPFLKARDWLCKPKSESLNTNTRAWVWDWLNREWRVAKRRDIYPGQTVLVESRVGGYFEDRGWDPSACDSVAPVGGSEAVQYTTRQCWKREGDGWCTGERRVRMFPPDDHADAGENDESLSITDGWQTIASHGLHVGQEVEGIAARVAPSYARLLHLAARWHDLGKAHPAFQGSIQSKERPTRDDIAKAPDIAWPCRSDNMYRIGPTEQRRGFRHELASTLGMFGVLQRHAPGHQALLGPWIEWLEAINKANGDSLNFGKDMVREASTPSEPTTVEQEILDLSAEEFDLVAYLVCAHHGKVRMTWHSSPADQRADDTRLRIRGIREGDILPPLSMAAADGGFHQLPATVLDLSPSANGLSPRTGRSWTERVLNLIVRFGPFTLAWLEAVLRAADQRASYQVLSDILLEKHHAERELDTVNQTVAQPADGGTQTPSHSSDFAPRHSIHGDGERAGGREPDFGTSHPPHSATRYVETPFGILSYRQLAPLLAERVADAELAIVNRMFPDAPNREVLLELHRRICADLVPDIAGRWRRLDVRVGEHDAPPYLQVPMLMHDYAADLETRLNRSMTNPDERLIESLVFAEGRLLHIHPFEDFNGRVTRLFLIELMYRLDLPVIDPAMSPGEETQDYFAALRAYDRRDPRPLAAIWRRRFEQEV